MILARRQFLRCLTGIVAAPAVVKADALMKVFAPKYPKWRTIADATPEELERLIRPPMGVSPELKNESASILPGSITYYDSNFYSLPQASWRMVNLLADRRQA